MYQISDVIKQLNELIAKYPDNINPIDGIDCLYTDWGDPNRHCIIGQWLEEYTDEGAPGPDLIVAADSVVDGLVTEDASRFMVLVQNEADHLTRDGLPWKHINMDVLVYRDYVVP